MQAKITKALLNRLKAGESEEWVWDTDLKGFGLRITPNDVRTYWVKYRMEGGRQSTTRKFKLGTHGELTPEQARTHAAEVLSNVRKGIDPSAEREAKRQPKIDNTVKGIVELFLSRHASQLRSVERMRGTFERDIISKWGGRDIGSIARRDVIELVDGVIDSGRPVQANRVFSLVRLLFNWCLERDIVAVTPCSGMKAQTAEQSRDRVLDDDELRLVWQCADTTGYPFGPWVRLLVLTAQRRDEVAGMTWAELNLDGAVWTIPKERAKNDTANEVPLPPLAVEILRGLPRTGEHVFTTTGKTPISGYSKAKATLDRKVLEAMTKAATERGDDPEAVTALPDWTFHDIRRTVATNLAKLGTPVHVVEKLLNHVSGTIKGVAAVYNRHSYQEERRQAMEAWANRLDRIVNGTPINVVSLVAKRR